eukprot:748739-Hanusia_phi.AAC.1
MAVRLTDSQINFRSPQHGLVSNCTVTILGVPTRADRERPAADDDPRLVRGPAGGPGPGPDRRRPHDRGSDSPGSVQLLLAQTRSPISGEARSLRLSSTVPPVPCAQSPGGTSGWPGTVPRGLGERKGPARPAAQRPARPRSLSGCASPRPVTESDSRAVRRSDSPSRSPAYGTRRYHRAPSPARSSLRVNGSPSPAGASTPVPGRARPSGTPGRAPGLGELPRAARPGPGSLRSDDCPAAAAAVRLPGTVRSPGAGRLWYAAGTTRRGTGRGVTRTGRPILGPARPQTPCRGAAGGTGAPVTAARFAAPGHAAAFPTASEPPGLPVALARAHSVRPRQSLSRSECTVAAPGRPARPRLPVTDGHAVPPRMPGPGTVAGPHSGPTRRHRHRQTDSGYYWLVGFGESQPRLQTVRFNGPPVSHVHRQDNRRRNSAKLIPTVHPS